MNRSVPILVAAMVTYVLVPSAAAGEEGYYRFPALHGDTVVFTSEGDLWTVGIGGGTARRLTTHLAEETHPALSPDGTTVAFSASYEGPTEVYTMPVVGGLPQRRTWEGESAVVVGWTPDGAILYRTRKYSGLPSARLVRLDPVDGDTVHVPLAEAADGVEDPADGTLFFTRYPMQGSHTKRYRGGTAQNLWRYGPGDHEATPLTADWPGTSKDPMWWDGRVYFASDRDGTMNLWSMTPAGADLRQHTRHAGWDVKDPAHQAGRIVYQLGADLRVLDLRSGEDRRIPIALSSDFDQSRERWVRDPMKLLTRARLSGDGERVVLTARGEVFVLPVRAGRLVEATRRSGVRYRNARFLPEDERLLVLSDESGEVEWWTLPADGIGERRRITADGNVLRIDGTTSPDGRFLAHFDHDQQLWLTEIETGESRKLDDSPQWGFSGPAWSPDSRWVAWARPGDNAVWRIHVYRVDTGERFAATSDRFDSWNPTWSPDGDWLYFLSDRTFRSVVLSPWGARQPEPFFDRSTGIYALALEPGLRFPFDAPDELTEDDDDRADADDSDSTDGEEKIKSRRKRGDAGKDDDADDREPVEILREGLADRLHQVPVDAGNLAALEVAEDHLFWTDRTAAVPSKTRLVGLEIDRYEHEPKTIASEIRSYDLSADGEKLLIRKNDSLYVVDATASEAELDTDHKVDLSGWSFALDPREEWRQMFVESWRLARDYFYDPGMHGVDWEATRDKYFPLVERVRSREELSDLQAQMASELSALHTFVRSGDPRRGPDRAPPGSLGATFAPVDDGLRVEHVFQADPDLPGERSPLDRPGVDVEEGDVLLAINGVDLAGSTGPGALLRNQAGKPVRLRVRSADGGEPRDIIVRPMSARDASDLRYDEWEYTRRLRVEELGGGEIGYVHLRAMGAGNMAEWQRDFYPVFQRKGLIIDARHNRGGNIDSWILSRLLRRAWMYWQPRVGDPYWNMQYAFRGHMVVLVDAWTASDGEAFAEGFRRLGLGKILGTRTWGGEIWLTSSNVLVDRGIVTAAEFGVYGPEGEWLIEGHGVEPDIVVDNLPHATFLGRDAQLETAVRHLLERMEGDPREVPEAPPYPDKSGNRAP